MLRTSPVFLRCASLVSPEAFLSLCEEEACHCGQGDGLGVGPDCHCQVLLEFARTCHAHGQVLHGWLEESQCSESLRERRGGVGSVCVCSAEDLRFVNLLL